MLKPTRIVLALSAGSLVLGLAGAGAAVADQGPMDDGPARVQPADDEPQYDQPGVYPKPRHALGKVVSRGPLKVRSHPSTHAKVVGKVHPHEKLAIECKKRGERVDGNNIWYLLDQRKDGKEPLDGSGRPADGVEDGTEDGMDEGAEGSDGTQLRKDRVEYKEAWVSARYVKDITPVKWCR
ncbi:hypothetical protein ACIP46_02030 [Streptomyces lavendulae]|uniref:hypothetical protein n=1 Tax=Streptomyces lavendulae TaxID=1914 RepID=UPI00332F140F